jgi:hypothetical protein
MAAPAILEIPLAVSDRVNRLVDSGEFYAFAEIPQPGSREKLFCHFEDLTVAHCEQLVEEHTRRARKLIARYEQTGSPSTARTAAGHIFRANRYRLRYYELLGQDFDPADLPFPYYPAASAQD